MLLLYAEACANLYVVRLAPEETSIKLTGFEHNAVTCIGMKTKIPVCFVSTPLFHFRDRIEIFVWLKLTDFSTSCIIVMFWPSSLGACSLLLYTINYILDIGVVWEEPLPTLFSSPRQTVSTLVLYFVLRNIYREFFLSYTCSCQAFCRHYSLLSCPRGPEGFSVQWVTQLGFVLFVSLSLYRRMWCIITQFALVRSRS